MKTAGGGTVDRAGQTWRQKTLTPSSSDGQDAAMSDEAGKFVDVPGGFVYYQTRGQGQDVVLLSAGGADLRMWETTISWLSKVARVTMFDYRDTGLSSPGTRPYSEIEDIAAVMKAAGVLSAVLVGVSDGARRALAFAHRYPDRARRVVAVGGTFGEFPDPSPEETAARQEMLDHFARRERAQADGGVYAAAEVDTDGWAPALGPHHRRKMIGLHVANAYLFALEDYLGSELDPPVKTRFGEIATPISVLAGGRDFKSTQLWAQRIANQAPDASLTVVSEADHFPMLSAPRQFERFLREALV
jgi:pimeloyl-ACP methyl ester carboxylesterase